MDSHPIKLMTPYERIAQRYQMYPQAQSFEWYVEHHLKNGFVFSRPDFFVMGRPVCRYAPASLITEPTYLFDPDQCDCWYVFAMAGDLTHVWDILPWELEYVAWERILDSCRELRFYKSDRIQNLCMSRN